MFERILGPSLGCHDVLACLRGVPARVLSGLGVLLRRGVDKAVSALPRTPRRPSRTKYLRPLSCRDLASAAISHDGMSYSSDSKRRLPPLPFSARGRRGGEQERLRGQEARGRERELCQHGGGLLPRGGSRRGASVLWSQLLLLLFLLLLWWWWWWRWSSPISGASVLAGVFTASKISCCFSTRFMMNGTLSTPPGSPSRLPPTA